MSICSWRKQFVCKGRNSQFSHIIFKRICFPRTHSTPSHVDVCIQVASPHLPFPRQRLSHFNSSNRNDLECDKKHPMHHFEPPQKPHRRYSCKEQCTAQLRTGQLLISANFGSDHCEEIELLYSGCVIKKFLKRANTKHFFALFFQQDTFQKTLSK